MKIKDLEKTVNICWSPAPVYPALLAAGTAAQQLDASFNTNASLEIYSLNLSEPGMDLALEKSANSEQRFYKIVWGGSNIIGGCDSGIIQIFGSEKLNLVSKQEKHSGAVTSLDFNPFQANLLASGASDSEIFIWDLNNLTTPMTPGAKSQPLEAVQCVSWNRQVQHILATAFCARCVVWDLRKNEPIIKLSDAATHLRWKSVCWHPEVATQLCLASEDDQSPVIQLWDLRFATSPLKVLDNHTRGVLAVDWCQSDSDLMLSCGKDNRILCWNPNSNESRGEVLAEVAQTLQWNFDISWCPRNPAVFAAASFDGHVSIYSLMGGKQQQVQTSNKIADSFPGMDGYVQAPLPQQAPPVSVDLAKAPKWLKRPVGASFAFGGKLVSFEADSSVGRQVHISQVITEPDLIKSSKDLEDSLQTGNYAEYCRQKADATENQHDRYVWHFLKANFEQNPKLELLNLLGYNPNDINQPENRDLDDENIFDNLGLNTETKSRDEFEPYRIKTGQDTDGQITQAILVGNIETAVDLCINSDRMADALIIAMTGGADLLARTQHRYLQKSTGVVSALISALVMESWTEIINSCHLSSWKEALAAILTHSTPEEFPRYAERLGERLEQSSPEDAQLCYITAGAFNKLVRSWDLQEREPKKVQDLVQLVTFMQKSMELQGRPVEIKDDLASLLSNYAELLASQGLLAQALNFLGAAKSDSLNQLRERLYINLGQKQQQNVAPRRTSSIGPQPARPNSAGGAGGGPRNKYIVDPSVQPGYHQMRPAQVPLLNPLKMPQNSMPQQQLQPQLINPIQQQPQMQYQPPQMYQTLGQSGQLPPPPTPPAPTSQGLQGLANLNDMMNNMMHSQPGWNDPPVVNKNLRPKPKNDVLPPMPITHPLFSGQQPDPQIPQMPQNGYGEMNNFVPQYGQQPSQQQQQAPQTMPPLPVQRPQPQMMPQQQQQLHQQQQQQLQQQQQQQQQQQVVQAQEVMPKAPLPEEHIYLQTVFNELQAQCSCAANNPQTKRKLEDVSRKLETLYDMLRAHKLSPQTLTGLHQMVQMVQIGDYTNGLSLHTQLVSGPDFSQIASFMPGLKVLLQCALQLQVYLR